MNAKFLSSMLAGLVVSWMVVSAQAEDKKAPMTKEMQAKMAKMVEAGTPGPNHAILKAFEGEWTVTSRSRMKPGDKPEQSKGTSSLSWIFEGRFLKQTFKGDMGGQPFEGIGYVGYDNTKKEYVSIWMDSLSTGIFQSKGQYDAASKTIKDEGTYSCAMTDEKDKWFRSEWKLVDKNKHTYSMYTKDPSGKEFKMMELVYKRAK